MKCDFCEKEFPDDELAEVDITPQDAEGKPTGDTRKFNVCEMCCAVIDAVGIEKSELKMMQEGAGE